MEKIYRHIIYTISLIAVLSFAACKKDFLNISPIGSLSEATLANKAGINKLLIGAYAGLYIDHTNNSGYGDGGWVGYGPFYSDIASHEAAWGFQYEPNTNSFERHDGQPSFKVFLFHWRNFYFAIQRANDVIRVLAQVPEGQLTATESQQIKAEAVFLRAVNHFRLAMTWGNVPYVDESITAANCNLPNDVPIWSKIEADFQFAADNLDEVKPDAGRANKWAAKAFLAEVYMQQGKYADALPLLTDCIDNGVTANGTKYALIANYPDILSAKTEINSEMVFAVQYTADNVGHGTNGNWEYAVTQPVIPPNQGGGGGFCSFDMANTFKTDAVTGLPLFDTYDDFNLSNDQGLQASDPFTPYAGTLDPRLDFTLTRRGIPFYDWGLFNVGWAYDQPETGPYSWKKFTFSKADQQNYTQANWVAVTANNVPLIRFADVLLRAAECLVETGGSLSTAEGYVNQVRTRASNQEAWVKTYVDDTDPSKGFTNTPAANYFIGLYTGQFTANGQEYARKAVRFERRLELALEGHRFFDLQRWDNGTGYMADELNRIIDYQRSFWDVYPGIYPNLNGAHFTKGKSEVYPIPQDEIDLSVVNGVPKLKQNPGY